MRWFQRIRQIDIADLGIDGDRPVTDHVGMAFVAEYSEPMEGDAMDYYRSQSRSPGLA